MRIRIVRHLIALSVTAFLNGNVLAAETEPAAPSSTEEISERGLSIAGCEITYKNMVPDLDKLKNCITGRIDKIKDDASDAKDAANKQVQNLQSELNNLKNNPLLAKAQSEIKTLQAVKRLQLESLFSCLASTGQGSADVPQLVNRFVANPAEFMNWFLTGLMAQWEQHFNDIMAEQLQLLRNPSSATLPPPQLVDMTLRSVEKLIKKDPAAACLWQFTAPQMTPLRNMSVQLSQNMLNQGKRIFDAKVAPVLLAGVNQQLAAVLNAAVSLPAPSSGIGQIRPRSLEGGQEPAPDSPEETVSSRAVGDDAAKKLAGSLLPELSEIKTLTQGVLAEHLLNPQELLAASGRVQNLSQALTVSGSRDAQLQALRVALDPNSDWTEALYIDIGMEILRLVGDRYIESEEVGGGGFLIGKAIGTLNIGEVTVGGVVQSAAGLVPEAGSVVAFVVREGPDAVFQLTIPDLLKKTTKAMLHFAYGTFIDEAKKAMKQGRPYDTIKQQVGLFAALLPYLPSKQQMMFLADTHTKDVKAALTQYNRSVLQLAETAARR